MRQGDKEPADGDAEKAKKRGCLAAKDVRNDAGWNFEYYFCDGHQAPHESHLGKRESAALVINNKERPRERDGTKQECGQVIWPQ